MSASSFRRFLRSWRIKSPQSSTIRYTINNHWQNKSFVNLKILKMGNAAMQTTPPTWVEVICGQHSWFVLRLEYQLPGSPRIVILSVMLSHTIHVVRYIYLQCYMNGWFLMVFHPGKYTSPMDPMGMRCHVILHVHTLNKGHGPTVPFPKVVFMLVKVIFEGCKTAKHNIWSTLLSFFCFRKQHATRIYKE